MLIISIILIFMNCLTEYQFNKMMLELNVLDMANRTYHIICAALRVIWLYMSALLGVPMPVMLIGLFILLFLNVIPYRNRSLLMKNFNMIIYLIYVSLLMLVIGVAGLIGINVEHMVQNTTMRVVVMNVTFIIFNIICFRLLRAHPEFLWKEDYDRFKVATYTRFLFICILYHILDAVILTVYSTSRLNYLLLLSGDILILFLMFNFMNYNYVFAKSEEMKKEYEEDEIMMAQQYFEKETLKKISEYDALTNTFNRREISSIMLEKIQKGHRLVCVFIDLDGLKRMNDKYGHTYGDLMLKRFADACTEILQEKGYLARIGGDEFLLIFLDQEITFVENCVRDLQLKLLEPLNDKEKIYFSYGISYDENSVDDYIVLADQRMYEDKGRKRCGDI